MKHLFALVLVAGCAAGSRPQGGEDASGQHDAAIDGTPILPDAPLADAPLFDAPLIDAPLADAPLIDAPVTTPDACVPTLTELAVNRNFDLTPIGVNWTEVRYVSTFPLVVAQDGFNAQSGTQFAYLGDYEADFLETANDYLYQQFTIPANTTKLVVSGYVAVATAEAGATPYDFAAMGFLFPNAPSTPPILVLELDNTDAATANMWTPFSVTILQNISGQTVRFQMESESDDSYATAFAFDSLSVVATSGCP